MPFETERTIMRSLKPGDSDLLFDLYNDPEIQSLAFTEHVAPRLDKWIKEMASSHENFPGFVGLVEEKETRAFVGHVSLVTATAGTKRHECSLSIALKREWRGKGIGTEITRWLINHAFGKLAVHRVTLKVLSNNDRALALYKRIGFVQKCRIRKYTFDEDDGTWSDLISMAILDEEWDRQRGVKVSRQVEAQ